MLSGYVEVHHVVPRCMGGSEEDGNLVQLTPEEHFVAHQLLHKMHPRISGLAFALMSMTGNPHGQRSNKLYGWIRRKISLAASETRKAMWQDPEYRIKHKAAMDEVRTRPGYGEKISIHNKGRVKSPEEIAKFVASKTGMKYKPMSAESRANMGAARRKTWAERRANGTDKLIAVKIRETRIKNGSYEFSAEHLANMTKANRKIAAERVYTDEQRAAISKRMKEYRALH